MNSDALEEFANHLAQISALDCVVGDSSATQGQDYLARRDEADLLRARIADLEAENATKQEMLTLISTRVQMWADRNAELVAEIAGLKQSIAAEVIAGVDAYRRSLTPAPPPDVSRETFPHNALKHSR